MSDTRTALSAPKGRLTPGHTYWSAGSPEPFLGLAHSVLDRVLMQHETFRRSFIAAIFLKENPLRVAQPAVVLVIAGRRPQGLDDSGPQQLDRA